MTFTRRAAILRAAALPVIREAAGQEKWLSGLGASGERGQTERFPAFLWPAP